MNAKYAEGTKVSTDGCRMEIERTLRRYKADAFAYATEGRHAAVMFKIGNRQIRLTVTLPDPADAEFTHSSRGRRAPYIAEAAWEQACRQKWRALALVIKAKLEAVAAGITTVEDEFLASTVMADGSTLGQWAKPQIDEMYRLGHMPKHLMIGGPTS